MTLKEHVHAALEKRVALGHFNISNLEGFWAVVNAAKKLSLPVIIGVSEGERDFVGISQIKALIDTIKAEGLPIFLNADHTYSFERIKEVVDAGFDSVIIDEAEKGFDENLKVTKEAVEYAKSSGKEILVEAELGFIGKSSKILTEVPKGVQMTTVEESKKFVEAKGEDDDGVIHTDTFEFSIDVERRTHEVKLVSASFSNSGESSFSETHVFATPS